MNKVNFSLIFKSAKNAIIKHSPEILTGMGIAGMITAGVLAVRATPKAMTLIEEKKQSEKTEKFSSIETVKTAWTCYIPAVLTAGASAACLIGASSVNLKRNAALAAAYTLSESTLKEYQEKVIETIGEKKEQTVHDAIAKDKLEQHPVSGREIIITGSGDTLCYDVAFDRYFRSDIEKLRKIENNLNRQMRDEGYISLNDFYIEVGLKPIPIGESLGWNIDRGYMELHFSSQLTDDGRPCLVINYTVMPKYGYLALR